MHPKFKHLSALSTLPGTPGHEHQIKAYIESEIKGDVDDILYDHLGSLIGKKGMDGPRIMIAGHMDEVGLLVTQITKEGFIKFQTLGGWFSQVMLAQLWDIHTPDQVIPAVTGVKPPHIIPLEKRSEAIPIEQMFLDIGVDSKEEALKLGVRPGQMITPHQTFQAIGDGKHLLSKAWDNRIGSCVVLEVLKRLKTHPNQLYGAFTVQEEVGLRGAKTASYVVRPDIAIAIDTGIAHDVPNGDPLEQSLGKGPQIFLYDSGLIAHQALRKFVIDIAKDQQIPYQECFVQRGSTDAGQMHLSHAGAPSIAIGIPTRYMHSHTSMIHYDDYENAIKLLLAVIEKLDKKMVNQLIFD